MSMSHRELEITVEKLCYFLSRETDKNFLLILPNHTNWSKISNWIVDRLKKLNKGDKPFLYICENNRLNFKITLIESNNEIRALSASAYYGYRPDYVFCQDPAMKLEDFRPCFSGGKNPFIFDENFKLVNL